MIARLFSILVVLLAQLPAGAAILKGVIRANEEDGQPMGNVAVAADGSNPTTSESFGRFTLEFPRKNPGDPVEVIVKEDGFVPVNDVLLRLELPARPEDKILTVILCKEADREEMARRFYRLKSFDAIEETYEKRVKELEDTQQATGVALAKLQQERDQARAAGYFRGPENRQRVKDWRKRNPGYWHKKKSSTHVPLQEVFQAQLSDHEQLILKNAAIALQDLFPMQPTVFVGLISMLAGSALQDDIVETTRALRRKGEEILGKNVS